MGVQKEDIIKWNPLHPLTIEPKWQNFKNEKKRHHKIS